MNFQETNLLLLSIRAVDNRNYDDATVEMWQQILADVEYPDASQAAVEHFANETTYLLPAHVRQGARAIAAERNAAARKQRELEAAQATAPTEDRRAEIQAIAQSIRDMGMPDDPSKLRPRAARWARDHRAWKRSQDPEPNPHYDPSLAFADLPEPRTDEQ